MTRFPQCEAEQPLAHELPYWAFLEVGARGTAGEPRELGIGVNVDLTSFATLELTGRTRKRRFLRYSRAAAHALEGEAQARTDK